MKEETCNHVYQEEQNMPELDEMKYAFDTFIEQADKFIEKKKSV